MKIIIFLLIFVSLKKCSKQDLDPTDFCFSKPLKGYDLKCHDDFKVKCSERYSLCAKDHSSCSILHSFLYKFKNKQYFEIFVNKAKNCRINNLRKF
jgi:hypothetical protein